jgi:uridine kinase
MRPFFGGATLKNNHSLYNIQESVHFIELTLNQAMKDYNGPLVVSFDGGSGSGKSTLASEVASSVGATIIHCDDFFAAKIPDHEWDLYSIEKMCRLCIDWDRVRAEALLPLLAGEIAEYHPFSFSTTNGLSPDVVVLEPSKIIILDGIYSSHWLSDLINLSILVEVSPDIRRNRHNLREGTEDKEWHLRWDPVEDYYFSVLRTPDSFDLVVANE